MLKLQAFDVEGLSISSPVGFPANIDTTKQPEYLSKRLSRSVLDTSTEHEEEEERVRRKEERPQPTSPSCEWSPSPPPASPQLGFIVSSDPPTPRAERTVEDDTLAIRDRPEISTKWILIKD